MTETIVYGVVMHVPNGNGYVVRQGRKDEQGVVSYQRPYHESKIVKEYKSERGADSYADKLNVEQGFISK